MGYDNESLRAGVKSQLVDNLAAALDAVETEYEDSDPVTLADPVTWHEGHNPEVLNLPSTSFPFVAVLAGGREPDRRGRAQWGYQEYEALCYIDFFVVADEIATVNKIVQRYARAIVSVMQAERHIGPFKQVDYEPEVKISEAARHPKTTSSDLLSDADMDYIQAGRIIVPFEGTS